MDFMINQRPKFLSVENPGCIFATFFVNNDLLGPCMLSIRNMQLSVGSTKALVAGMQGC